MLRRSRYAHPQEEVFGTPPRPEEVGGQTAAAAAAAKGAAGWVLDTAVSMLDSTAMEAAGGVDLKMFDELVRKRSFKAIYIYIDYMPSFYQDRLGTNRGKALKNRCRFPR